MRAGFADQSALRLNRRDPWIRRKSRKLREKFGSARKAVLYSYINGLAVAVRAVLGEPVSDPKTPETGTVITGL